MDSATEHTAGAAEIPAVHNDPAFDPTMKPEQRFSYCFWGKLFVAVPAIAIMSFFTAGLFDDPLTQLFVGGTVACGMVLLAVWVDKLPCLSGKIFPR